MTARRRIGFDGQLERHRLTNELVAVRHLHVDRAVFAGEHVDVHELRQLVERAVAFVAKVRRLSSAVLDALDLRVEICNSGCDSVDLVDAVTDAIVGAAADALDVFVGSTNLGAEAVCGVEHRLPPGDGTRVHRQVPDAVEQCIHRSPDRMLVWAPGDRLRFGEQAGLRAAITVAAAELAQVAVERGIFVSARIAGGHAQAHARPADQRRVGGAERDRLPRVSGGVDVGEVVAACAQAGLMSANARQTDVEEDAGHYKACRFIRCPDAVTRAAPRS